MEWPAQPTLYGVGVLWVVAASLLGARRAGLAASELFAVLGLAGVAGAAGARLVWFGGAWAQGLAPGLGALVGLGGGVSSLGLLGGAGAVVLGALGPWGARLVEAPGRALDVLTCSGLMGLGVARLGCMSRGCDFGRRWEGPGATRYEEVAAPAWVHFQALGQLEGGATPALAPFGLWLGAATLAIGAAGWAAAPRARPGRVAWGALVAYAGARLVCEGWRHPAAAGPQVLGLSWSQVGMAAALAALAVMGPSWRGWFGGGQGQVSPGG